MTQLNRGLDKLNPYIFTQLEIVARKFGDDLIQLVSGNPDLPTPIPICERLRDAALSYSPNPPNTGTVGLRHAVVEYYKSRFNVSLHPEEVIIGHGTKSDLGDIARLFSNPGDCYAVADPGYPIVSERGYFDDRVVLSVPYIEKGANKLSWDIKNIESNSEKLAVIYLCNPNNPNGALAELEEMETLVSIAAKRSALILSDIVYADFRLLGKSPSASIFQVPGAEQVAIELGGFKVFSMTGYRVSWAVIRNPSLARAWKSYKSNRDKGTATAIQHAAETALRDPEVSKQVGAYLAEYGKRAQVLHDGLTGLGFRVFGLEHTPFAWIETPRGLPSEKFCERLLSRAKVMLVPGSAFGKRGDAYVRASIFSPLERIQEALSLISELQ